MFVHADLGIFLALINAIKFVGMVNYLFINVMMATELMEMAVQLNASFSKITNVITHRIAALHNAYINKI
jgi:hypothetical protein